MNLTPVATAALLFALIGCAGGPDARPSWTEAADADLAGYERFGWLDPSGKPPVTILDNSIRDAIRAGLIARGYVESADAPDFQIDHETVEQESMAQGNPVRIGIGLGTRSGNVGGSVGTSVGVGGENRVQRRMVITIRAVEPGSRREAWVGSTAALDERPDAATIERAVAGLLKGFPPRRR